MKILKVSAFVALGVILLAGLLVGLALTPAVQTWALRRAVAGRPGLHLEVGRVAAGFSSAELSHLRLEQNGLVLAAGDVAARYSVWNYLLHRRIELEQVTVRDLSVDARHVAAPAATPATPARPAGGPPAFLAVLTPQSLPVDLKLGQLDVTGRALLPGGRTAAFSLHGGGIAIGSRGRLEWTVDYADATAGAPLQAAHATGALDLTIAADRRIAAVDLENTASLTGRHLPTDLVRVHLTAGQSAAGSDEVCALDVALVHADQTSPVLTFRSDYLPSTREFNGTWSVAPGSARLAGLLSAYGLPQAAITGSGKFTFNRRNGALSSDGELQGALSGLHSLGASFADVGPLRLRAAYDAGLAGGVLRLTRFELSLATSGGHRLIDVSTLQPVTFNLGEKRFQLSQPGRELARIAVQDLPLSWAQPVVKPVAIESGVLAAAFDLQVDPDGRTARLETVTPVTLTNVTLRDSGRPLVEGMTLSLNPAVSYSAAETRVEISNFRLLLPAGDTVAARFSASLTHAGTTPVLDFSAQTDERLVSVLRPLLKFDPGPLALQSALAGRWEGRQLQLSRLSGTLKTGKGDLVATVDTLQPVTVDLAAVRMTARDPAAPAARVRLGLVPLAVAQAFLPGTELAGALMSGELQIGFPTKETVSLQTTAPLRLRGVGVTREGRALAAGLDIEADFSATGGGRSFSASVKRIEIQHGRSALITFSGSGQGTLENPITATAKGRLEADLAALAGQPGLAGLVALSGGTLTADFDVTTADTVHLTGTVAARNLTAGNERRALGDLDVTVDAALKRDGSGGQLQLPVTLTVGGRRSDLTLQGSFQRTAKEFSFDGRLTSALIVAGDFQALVPLLPASQPVPTSTPTAPAASAAPAAGPAQAPTAVAASATPDVRPFWAGVAGRFDANLKEVRYGPGNILSDVSGIVLVNDQRLALDHLSGRFKKSPFKISADLTFTPGRPAPYALSGQANVPDFDTGAFLRAADPGEPPALESLVTVNAKLAGTGATLPDLLQNTQGQFDITGTKGVLRALGKRGELAGAASTVLGLIGALRGSDTTMAVGQLAGMLKELPFDRFTADVVRGADLNLKLSSLEFVSPAMHLTGTGSVQYRKGVPVADQPLRVDLQLSAKQDMATVLNRLNLLNGQKDTQGYYLMSSPFVVTGTLAKPDAKQLWSIVGAAAARAAAGAIFR